MNNSPEDSSLAAEEIGALKDHSEPKILAPSLWGASTSSTFDFTASLERIRAVS